MKIVVAKMFRVDGRMTEIRAEADSATEASRIVDACGEELGAVPANVAHDPVLVPGNLGDKGGKRGPKPKTNAATPAEPEAAPALPPSAYPAAIPPTGVATAFDTAPVPLPTMPPMAAAPPSAPPAYPAAPVAPAYPAPTAPTVEIAAPAPVPAFPPPEVQVLPPAAPTAYVPAAPPPPAMPSPFELARTELANEINKLKAFVPPNWVPGVEGIVGGFLAKHGGDIGLFSIEQSQAALAEVKTYAINCANTLGKPAA